MSVIGQQRDERAVRDIIPWIDFLVILLGIKAGLPIDVRDKLPFLNLPSLFHSIVPWIVPFDCSTFSFDLAIDCRFV